MKRIEMVYREILYQSMEQKKRTLTQSYLSKKLGLSLSTINLAMKPLRKMNAVRVKLKGLDVIDVRKILFYWASTRNLQKDIVYSTRVDKSVGNIESEVPSDAVFTAYSGFKFIFRENPSDYSEVYLYASDLAEIKKRFPESRNQPNLFVLKKDNEINKMTYANLFVDLWNIHEWYAREYLKALEEKINGLLE